MEALIEEIVLGKTVCDIFTTHHPLHNDTLVIKFTDGASLVATSSPTIPDGSFVLSTIRLTLEQPKEHA